MEKRSRHHHPQSSMKRTRSNSVIHISIRPVNTTSSSTNNKSLNRHNNLNTFSANLNPRYHRDEVQKKSNIQNLVNLSKNQALSVNIISDNLHRHYRPLSPSSENTNNRNHRNKISPKPDKFSTEIVNNQQRQDKATIFNRQETSNASSDRIGAINDHHHNLNRKKKKKCPHLVRVISIFVGVLLGIAAVILLTIFLIKSKTTQGSMPTGTNYILRWNKIGDTIAGGIGQNGTGSNRLYNPFDMAIDYSNTIYITDCDNNRIQRWLMGASTGTTIGGQANGTSGGTSSDLSKPAGILVDSNSNIYVADSGNSRIQFWSAGASSGVTIAGNGTGGDSNSQFNITYDIALDSSSSTLYVADYGNHRVMSYALGASSGTVVVGTGTLGTNMTQLSFPSSLYFDSPSNSLIIVNSRSHNVVRWSLGASSWTLVAGSDSGVFGNTSAFLTYPVAMTMDPMGNVYVADMLNNRIQLFLVGQLDGITIAGVAGVSGTNSILLNRPYSMVLDNQLNLYVVDTFNNRIQRYLRY